MAGVKFECAGFGIRMGLGAESGTIVVLDSGYGTRVRFVSIGSGKGVRFVGTNTGSWVTSAGIASGDWIGIEFSESRS